MDRRLVIVFLIMFTEILGFSIIMPVLPYLGLSLGLNPLEIGFIASLFSTTQFISAPITGKLSDSYGRRKILMISQLSTMIGFVLLGLSDRVWILVLARITDGLLGSNYTVTQAYIADVSTSKDRAKNFAYGSGIFGAGIIFGPMIGGFLSRYSYSLPMFLAAAVTLLSIILVYFFLEETVTEPQPFILKFTEIVPVKETRKFIANPESRFMLISFGLYNFAFFVFMNNMPLLTEILFSTTPEEVGYYYGYVGVLRVILQVFFVAWLLRKLGETRLLYSGAIALLLSLVSMLFITDYVVVFLPLILLAYGSGVCRPVLNSKLTSVVDKKEVGRILGVNNAISSLLQVITPIIGGWILTNSNPLYLISTSIVLFAIFILYGFLNRQYLLSKI